MDWAVVGQRIQPDRAVLACWVVPGEDDDWCRRCGCHVVAHTDRGSQYPAIRHRERLDEAGIAALIGSVGSSSDNALAESINGLHQTELIKPRGPWRTLDAVEIATAEWVDWFNHRRLYAHCGDIPPADLETASYAQNPSPAPAALSSR